MIASPLAEAFGGAVTDRPGGAARASVICYRQKQDIAWRAADEQAVLIEPLEGVVFVLNQVGCRIWSMLEEARRPSDVVRAIARDYRKTEDEVAADTYPFLEALVERGLIEEVNRG